MLNTIHTQTHTQTPSQPNTPTTPHSPFTKILSFLSRVQSRKAWEVDIIDTSEFINFHTEKNNEHDIEYSKTLIQNTLAFSLKNKYQHKYFHITYEISEDMYNNGEELLIKYSYDNSDKPHYNQYYCQFTQDNVWDCRAERLVLIHNHIWANNENEVISWIKLCQRKGR